MIWNKIDIRNARKKPLASVLRKIGYKLIALDNNNFCLEKNEEIIIKNNFWYHKNTKKSGNTIDFFIYIKNMSFKDAMKIIMKN